VLICIYLCLVCFIVFCVFVLGYDSSAPNGVIVRLRCEKESYTLSTHIFVKIFQFLYSFSWFWSCLCLFDWSLISNRLVGSLYVRKICMIGHLSIV